MTFLDFLKRVTEGQQTSGSKEKQPKSVDTTQLFAAMASIYGNVVYDAAMPQMLELQGEELERDNEE